MCAHAVNKFRPNIGLKTESLESSTIRSNTSLMSKGFRISGSTRARRSSAGYRGGRGLFGTKTSSASLWRAATHSRAFRMASNLVSVSNVDYLRVNNIMKSLLVGCHLIGQSRDCCMNFGTSKLFCSYDLPGGHLYQWRPS